MVLVWPHLTLCVIIVSPVVLEQPWSPLGPSGAALTPPVIQLIHSPPIPKSVSLESVPRYQEPWPLRPASYRGYRSLWPIRKRRRRKRRRRLWPGFQWGVRGTRRARRRQDWDTLSIPRSRRQEEEGRSLSKTFRSLLGAPEHCLEDGRQFSCTFTPLCWLSGGVATQGCDSILFSCCRPPSFSKEGEEEVVFEARQRKVVQEQEPECGVSRHRQFSKRIIGGEKAKFSELPWQAHIRISSYQCGGVLLNHWYIATAAHCVHRAKLSKITVHLGEYDTKDGEEEPLESQSYKVDHIVIHPDFRYMLTQPDRFDVALLHLDRPVFYQDNIIPICLPPGDISLSGKVGLVAGWGKTDNSFGKTGTNILHKVLVPVIDNEECIDWHEDKNIIVQLHNEMFCAGHKKGKMDACLGDSGGPLIIHYNGRWTLIGITSAGFGCAVDKQPGIYHKIGKTAGWILNQISP